MLNGLFLTKILHQGTNQPITIACLSGALMGLTPAPFHAWPLAWIALSFLWGQVISHEQWGVEKPLKKPFWVFNFAFPLGFAWGVGYHGLALSWITGIHPMTWMGVPWLASLAIALACWVAITTWGALLVATWAGSLAAIIRWVQPAIWARVLIGTALWCGLEWLWSTLPLWWTSLSYTQSPTNLVILHLGQLSGPSTVTAAIVLVNALLAESWWMVNSKTVWNNYSKAAILFSLDLVCLIALHLTGLVLYSRPLTQPPGSEIKVGIIQGNVPNTIKLYAEGWERAMAGYTTGYRDLAQSGVQAVLTPETALPFLWTSGTIVNNSFYQAIRQENVVAWVGGFGQTDAGWTNSLFTVMGDGQIFSRYDKAKLVPLGEYIPFKSVLGGIINRLSPLQADAIAGQPGQVFDTPFGRAIAGICYDSAFSEHFRQQAAQGGEFILSASNDAHYSWAMPAQHHAQDVMRAIETDRWAVRATNTGYSAIVDPHGHTRWISRLNTYTVYADTIHRRQTQTLYVRWGDWLTIGLGIGAIAVMGGGIIHYPKSKK